MPRPRKTLPPPAYESTRRETISLRSVVKYDPMAPRPTTPILVGQYVVARRPLQGSVHTLYMILDGAEVVRTSISIPSEGDCADAITAHRRRQAASITDVVIAKAKKRRACAKTKEAA